MAALADEVQVDLAQRRQEPVGVVVNVNDPVVVRDPDPVVGDLRGWQDTDPDALELMAELGARAISSTTTLSANGLRVRTVTPPSWG